MTYTPKYASAASGRIDTTVTEVAVKGGDTSQTSGAIRYVRDEFPDAVVIGAWRTGERDPHGYPVFAVEWESTEE